MGEKYPGLLDCDDYKPGAITWIPDGPVRERPGIKHVPLPDGAGKLVSATVFHDRLLIACENGVWIRTAAELWEKIEL